MTLGFSQQIKGVKNYFPEKIWECLNEDLNHENSNDYFIFLKAHKDKFGHYWDQLRYTSGDRIGDLVPLNPKRHTIRQGLGRWRAGMDIHMVINNRTKNRFQFTPTIKCKSVQTIEIKNVDRLPMNSKDISCLLTIPVNGENYYLAYQVKVDGELLDSNRTVELAINDGFDSVDAFFAYFNKDFTGTLIHWTDLKF